jgi:hypothetical protein
MQIDDDDYTPIDTFVLRWRWDEKHCPTMTAEELSHIHPLSPTKSREVYKTLQLRYSDFTSVAEILAEGNPTTVQRWLEATLPHSAQPIILVWGPNVAVLTDRTSFIHWWDTFCYPASDDVAIWPTTKEWILRYSHEEAFYFAYGSQANN